MTSCKGDSTSWHGTDLSLFKRMPMEKIAQLSSLKIFFGHQSVGANILDGVNDIKNEVPGFKMSIVPVTDKTDWGVPIFGHANVGQNKNPEKKCDDFSALMKHGVGANADIAFMKFCYIDFDENTDVIALFRKYETTIDAISVSYPRLRLIHLTVPVRQYPDTVKLKIFRAIGKVIPDDVRNAKRNEFNRMLIAQYSSQNSVFDLAAYEAGALPHSGQRGCGFEYGGQWCYTLCPEFTDDGGHLNKRGRVYVAEQLLLFIARYADER